MSKVTVKRHLRELQWRAMLVAAFFIIGACLAYYAQEWLIPALLDPLHGEKLVYLNPGGGFTFIFLVSIYAGIAFSFPILIQQLYSFLRPVLPEHARKKSPVIIISSFILLLAGIAFGYLIAVPNALEFLYGFADQYVEASLTADSYLNFVIAYTIGIGIVFQLPLLLLLVNSIKPLTPGGLMKSEKWVLLIAFIIAAIITPTPDPVNQAIIAGPVVVVYQIGVIAVLLSLLKAHNKKKREARKARSLARREAILEDALEKDAETEAKAPTPLAQPAPARPTTLASALHAHAAEPQVRQQRRTLSMSDVTRPQAPQGSSLMAKLEEHASIQNASPSAAAGIRPNSAMDGIVRRPAQLPLQVPQRQHPTPGVKAPERPQTKQRPATAGRPLFIDGITAPNRAISI